MPLGPWVIEGGGELVGSAAEVLQGLKVFRWQFPAATPSLYGFLRSE